MTSGETGFTPSTARCRAHRLQQLRGSIVSGRTNDSVFIAHSPRRAPPLQIITVAVVGASRDRPGPRTTVSPLMTAAGPVDQSPGVFATAARTRRSPDATLRAPSPDKAGLDQGMGLNLTSSAGAATFVKALMHALMPSVEPSSQFTRPRKNNSPRVADGIVRE